MSEHRPISYQPTDGLTYNPSDEKYWNEKALRQEVERAFEICHGCRMCFKYCDAFPQLFEFIDGNANGDVSKVSSEQTQKVMDACFQCKLCEVQCPYTPRENHEYQLDFPKLVHRHQAVHFRQHGASLRDTMLGDPDTTAKLARASFGVANAMNRVKLHRWFLEKLVGIHRDKQLPDFTSTTFEKWAQRNDKIHPPSESYEAVLFQTCYVDHNEPQIGRDTIEVLEKNGVKVTCVTDLVCCGMPKWEHGDLEGLRKKAAHNIERLYPYVKKGQKVIAINPTCSMMLRKEYPELVPESLKDKAQLIAENTMDPSEFLWQIRQEPRFIQQATSSPTTPVSYHAPCHLRAQAKGFKGRDLIRKITGQAPSTTMECCGHDGTYAMKSEGFEPSKRIGEKAFAGMRANESEIWVTDCPLAALQFEQHAGVKPMHPMTFLAKAYRQNGFDQKQEPGERKDQLPSTR